MSLPVVLDTDIGTDIDDAYALVLAAVSPELDLRAVTTVNNGVEIRALIARTLLRLLGRDDVPVATGERHSLTPSVTCGWAGHEGKGIDLSRTFPARDLDPRPAPALLAELARAAHAEGNPLTLLPVGAMTNVAVAIRDYPQEMALLRGIVAMASGFYGFGEEAARGEHNVQCDPVAVEIVLSSGIPLTFIGLNVTVQTSMTRAQVEEMAATGGPLAEALAGMHRVWFDLIQRDQSAMHDPLAVAVAFRPELVQLLPVSARVRRDPRESGAIVYSPPAEGQAAPHRIATEVDTDRFHALLRERITRAVGRR